MSKKLKSLANFPTLGPGDGIGEGDSFIVHDLLDTSQADTIFETLHQEVSWQKMYHAAGEVPRLVAVQGEIGEDGSKPIYRHPSDQSPPLLSFTPGVLLVKQAAEKAIGHPLNHVLIQLYRDGKDYISEHSDKTLDIEHSSKIVNASFGAQRTMRLRRKRNPASPSQPPTSTIEEAQPSSSPREAQRIHMPHNSLFVLGLSTNRSWLHGINADKRLPFERNSSELAFQGMRISLTFRHIATFLSSDESTIWGQGATNKDRKNAGPVVIGDAALTDSMILAFGWENQRGVEFDWEGVYGGGFDVLHFRG